jgi:ABC-type Fe2+-enterobactin transport system substrate-binding protein
MIKVWTDAAEAGILERIEAAFADTPKGIAREHSAAARKDLLPVHYVKLRMRDELLLADFAGSIDMLKTAANRGVSSS